MVKFIRPEIRVKPNLSVAPRPLPRSLIETYYQTESEFRNLIESLEADPRFKTLVDKGVVRKVRLSGKVPHHRYEECKDEEMVRFFKKYDITRHPDWELDFLTPSALGKRHLLAKKYGVPVGELLSVLRYTAFLSTMRDVLRDVPCTSTDSEDKDFLKFIPGEAVFDTGPVSLEIARFVERYDISRDTFVDCFLSRDVDDESVLSRIPCSREEIARVRHLVDRIQVLNAFCIEAGPPRSSSSGKPRERFGPVAEFYRVGDGLDMKINLVDDGVYASKYRIDLGPGQPESELTRAEQEFMGQLKAINQRKNVLHRLIVFLFRYQYKYLLTGNPLDLYPLSQAAVAKTIFEEEATVSRLIRDKTVVTPHGVVPLKFFFHRVSKTVEDLVSIRERTEIEKGLRDRPFTDVEIREILRKVYGVDLSRRSITYHRNRCLKKSNFYTRVKKTRSSDRPRKNEGAGKG